ncbi:MAG TPA: MBL fold metallo-hydrolase [Pseudoalteromonas prydzensis]|uniref:MBL fold metallo-hydrolase n=2 Tax=root TaxID=1 RepID=A0A7V1CXJ5_9GAMM|nr:MBL fold metallo-hydrolase [Pseudoalteromonas prydzensis]HEA16186.1 MBL fold metallo-hydrolase [Pseudoalteromonas prydzensis]
MKTLTLLLSTLLATNIAVAKDNQLTLDVYNADSNSFHVNATLVYGERDAILVDTGFTKADALRIAAKVIDSGKQLKTIFISQADPDYYFGAEVLHQLFPEANIITTPAVQKVIAAKNQDKVAYWAPKMASNAPQTPILPTAYNGNTLQLESHTIEIRGTNGEQSHRPYLWIPDNKTILGNVAIYGDVHLWMADAQTDAEQTAWAKQLQEMQALQPDIVIPGHMKPGSKLDASHINFSSTYLKDFAQAKQQSNNSKMLIDKMTQSYSDAILPMALSIGAQVHTGEMTW